MSQQVRFLLFMAVTVLILVTWGALYGPKTQPGGAQAPVATKGSPEAAPSPAVTPAPAPGAEGAALPEPEPEPAVERATVETDLWTAVFTSKGAGLESFVLKGRKQQKHTSGGEDAGVELVHPGEGQPAPLSAEVGGAPLGLGTSLGYRLVARTDTSLVYERSKGGRKVTKTFRWSPGSYKLGLDVAVAREAGEAEPLPVRVLYPAWEANPHKPGMFSSGEVHQAECHLTGERSMEVRHYGTNEDPPLAPAQPASFAAADQKYFIAAIAPASSAQARCNVTAPSPTTLVPSLEVPASVEGGVARASFDLYLGPKRADLLEAFGHGAEVSVYDGSIAKAGKLLLPVLQFFRGLAGNWGVAIILLTILVKLVTFPLAQKQMVSMDKMRVLAPRMEEIKQKYDGDPQRQNLETMKLYRENDISPGGCAVPMLVQMPIWWALYSTLQNSYDLYNEPFFGWIRDLTAQDPYYVLPVLMTATMLLTTVLTPQTSPQAQQMKGMTYGMPVFFGFLMMGLPSGLVLYIFTNNLLSIAHSLWFRRTQAAKGAA
jgi:YidC/Oxa1 family membrane protein insertase